MSSSLGLHNALGVRVISQIRFSVALVSVLLVAGSAGCASTAQIDESTRQITVAERERMAAGVPLEDWKMRLYPESIARGSKLHTVGKVVLIGKPVAGSSDNLAYVPLRVNCMQGMTQGEMTFRFIPYWDTDDAILKLKVGQRILVTLGPISEDYAGEIALPVENIYLIDDDQTMRLFDSNGTVVGNLNDYRKQFGLD